MSRYVAVSISFPSISLLLRFSEIICAVRTSVRQIPLCLLDRIRQFPEHYFPVSSRCKPELAFSLVVLAGLSPCSDSVLSLLYLLVETFCLSQPVPSPHWNMSLRAAQAAWTADRAVRCTLPSSSLTASSMCHRSSGNMGVQWQRRDVKDLMWRAVNRPRVQRSFRNLELTPLPSYSPTVPSMCQVAVRSCVRWTSTRWPCPRHHSRTQWQGGLDPLPPSP